MTEFWRVLGVLFGRTFAIWIMGVLAVVMAIITVVESSRINPPTPFPWYQTPWFFGLLLLFCISILVVCVGPGQLRVARWPLIATHLGLVLLLAGGYLSYRDGMRGHLDLEENRTSDQFQGETPLLIIERDNLRRRIELESFEEARGKVVEGPGGDRYTVTTALFSVKPNEDGTGLIRDETGRGRSAIFLKPEKGPGAWLLREGPAAVAGEAKVRLTWMRPLGFKVTLLDARQVDWAASSTPRAFYSWVRIDDPDRNYSREWLVETNAPLYYRGFRFYQSGMPSTTRSVFQVTRDPGLLWVTLGICITGIGLIVAFALRFVRDPLARRRRGSGDEPSGEVTPEDEGWPEVVGASEVSS